ncbi:tetratricopeptide repeat protein [Bacteroides sp.]
MKNNITLTLLSIVFFLVACSGQRSDNRQLILADSLMQSQPDSALNILQDIPMEVFTTQADSAYYALLLTQARDKNYIVQTDDSLIRMAVQYYDVTGDTKMQAKAHYYWGCVWRDEGNHLKAIDEFYIAQTLAKKGKDSELIALIYSNVSYLYYIQDLNAEADSVYQLAEDFAIQQKDTISLLYALLQRSMINLEKGKNCYPKVEQQMQQALSLAEHLSDTTIKIPIYASLSTLYCEMEEAKKALQYAKLNYRLQRDTLHRCRASLLLGDAYFKNGQYDSAEVYLREVFFTEQYYDTKADACMRLAEIAEFYGKTETVAEMRKTQVAYMDSAQQNLQWHDILQNIMFQKGTDNELLRKQYVYSIIALVLVFFIAGSIIIMYYIKRNRKRQFIEEQQKQKLELKVDSLLIGKEEYDNSAVYIKLKGIARTLIRVETKENLNEEEWQQLIALTNVKWNGIITYLSTVYNLSGEEIQICCLYLAEIPVKYIGHFVKGYARSTIQLKARDIIQKMKAPQGSLLKKELFSLSQELKVQI